MIHQPTKWKNDIHQKSQRIEVILFELIRPSPHPKDTWEKKDGKAYHCSDAEQSLHALSLAPFRIHVKKQLNNSRTSQPPLKFALRIAQNPPQGPAAAALPWTHALDQTTKPQNCCSERTYPSSCTTNAVQIYKLASARMLLITDGNRRWSWSESC